ncbi:MAG TPA: hypothetical protein VNF47_06675 [Streptosporangiaceae bacterium]|nr:hypothetical protein [Streptosporangiaceae bacterium]
MAVLALALGTAGTVYGFTEAGTADPPRRGNAALGKPAGDVPEQPGGDADRAD